MDRPSRALALYGDESLAFRAGAQAESRERNQVVRAAGDREALALVGLCRVALRDGDYPRVRRLAAEARGHRAVGARAGDPGRRWDRADPDDAFEVDWLHDQLG